MSPAQPLSLSDLLSPRQSQRQARPPPPPSRLTCDFEGALGCVGDGGRDSHGRGLALLQGPRGAQADGLLHLCDLGRVIAALGPLPAPLGAARLRLQAAAVVVQPPGRLLLGLAEPAQPALCQGALLRVGAQLQGDRGPTRSLGGVGRMARGPSSWLLGGPAPPRVLSQPAVSTHLGCQREDTHGSLTLLSSLWKGSKLVWAPAPQPLTAR